MQGRIKWSDILLGEEVKKGSALNMKSRICPLYTFSVLVLIVYGIFVKHISQTIL